MTTWGQVHVGDTVRGGDQRLWVVTIRGATQRWAVGGDVARFTLQQGERVVAVDRLLANPVDLRVFAPDREEMAAAFGALTDGGLSPEIVSEGTSTVDPFDSAKHQPEIRNGRYVLPDPETGAEKLWTRVTNMAKTISNEYTLTNWKLAKAVKGLAVRPDLVAGAAAADFERDRKDLDSIVEQALAAAEASAGANLGTALHNFTRRLDAGEPVAGLRPPSPLDRDLAAYASEMKRRAYNVVQSERVVILPELKVAGSFDRIIAQPPGDAHADPMAIFDLKTGRDLRYSWLEIAMQLAMYAHAPLMWNPATKSYEPKPPVDLSRALVFHLPASKIVEGEIVSVKPEIYAVDIAKGWKYVELATKVRAARNDARNLAVMVKPNSPAALALHTVSRAASREELAGLWNRFHPAGLWTDEVAAAGMARLAELEAVSA